MVSLKRENGHVTEVVSLMEGEWSCYRGGQFNGENGHVTEVVTLMEGEWSCYRGGQLSYLGNLLIILFIKTWERTFLQMDIKNGHVT